MADMTEVTVLEDGSTVSVERDYTPDERAQYEADVAAHERAVTEAAEAERLRVAAVQAAQGELNALGLSDAAIATISGFPYPYDPTV